LQGTPPTAHDLGRSPYQKSSEGIGWSMIPKNGAGGGRGAVASLEARFNTPKWRTGLQTPRVWSIGFQYQVSPGKFLRWIRIILAQKLRRLGVFAL